MCPLRLKAQESFRQRKQEGPTGAWVGEGGAQGRGVRGVRGGGQAGSRGRHDLGQVMKANLTSNAWFSCTPEMMGRGQPSPLG